MHPFDWIIIFCLDCILFTFGSTTPSSNQKEVYNYAIDVWPVLSCPNNESEWQAAAVRAGCSGTRGYHCVPDKFHSRLIEFCYNRTRIFVPKEHCLELASNGVLNYVKCHEFTKGCPENHYFSNEIYKYPFCLSLAFQCFTSDIKCLDQKFKEQQNKVRHPDCTTTDCEGKLPPEIIVALILIVVVLCFGVSMLFLWIYRKKIEKLKPDSASMEQEEMDDLQVLGKLQGELVFEDIYLSLLLRRHCRNGVFKNFIYLLETRIMKKQKNEYDVNLLKILTTRDENGFTLLHYAAEGGSVDIVKALIKAVDEANEHLEMEDRTNIDDTTHDGLTVLHIACKNKNRSLCRHLLIDENYKDLLYKKSKQDWNAAHFAAMGGDEHIMNMLGSRDLDIKDVTKNGLNIFDIACIHNNTEMCKDLMSREDLKLPLDKSDLRGWTIAHFAAMAGNADIIDYLIAKKVQMVKTKNQKTILHVCSEFGNEELCKKILKHFGKMVHDKDEEGWNALHYAAKGGNLGIFKKIERFFQGRVCETTDDERTVLHIACINNRTDICHYICNKESYKDIINSTGEFRGWTAAHYVAVEERHDGTEETLIRTLVDGGINIKSTTVDGLTVLGVACEHRNGNLINFLLNEYNDLLGVGIEYLETAAKASNDDYIVARIQEALKHYNGEIVHVKVRKVSEKEGNIRFERKQGSEENVAMPEEEEERDSTFATKQGSEENEALLVPG
ncbi:putative ankyrin repeat protein RF_0381 isoform X2 [Crassostrea angulata]|uniref:putative ankyrin repeat protein RF_0381 isoform X2 n=1 Tax=Magallana angulata TaxID=2784310 RepID=UPI0022B1B2EB|nr:putative ankyrin repeat protein RF_0381 isoform X2 [Crassostrea angulata]